MKPTYFSIPQPCSENWNEMSATSQGAFCSKCTKEVIDCSNLKSIEIKNTVYKKEGSTCIRIFNHQIDELNFTEWYNSLSFRKQLKYLFLFAFLFVYNTSSPAQENDSDLIQPQYVEIDSADDMTALEVMEALNHQPDTLNSEKRLPELVMSCEIIPNETWRPYMGDVDIIVMGGFGEPIGPPIVTDFIKLNPYLTANSKENFEIIASNYLIVGDQKYTFLIAEDTLFFHSNAQYDEIIHLKIIKKDDENIVYFSPILILQGQREVSFPLYEFNNGAYLIIVQGETETKGVELLYW